MSWDRWLVLISLLLSACSLAAGDHTGAIKVEIVTSGSGYQLLRGGKPYEIRGAGLHDGDIVSFAAHGGNSIRNWGTHNAREVLDLAHQHGVTVALCLGVGSERHGFDYDDKKAVAKQLKRLRKDVLEFKDHPALLAWIIGNELNFDYTNPRVYDAVNDISKMIHELDPNHPTTTTVAGLGEDVLEDLLTRAPDLDILSFQAYGQLALLPEFIPAQGVGKPLWITEWGSIGHWEVPKTSWGAPLEMTSSEKAGVYFNGPGNYILPLGEQVIGNYAFLWGWKQEKTSTWFGLFTETGEATEAVDALHYYWNGVWPDNRSPAIEPIRLNGLGATDQVKLLPGKEYEATVKVSDPDGDVLRYRWELKPESAAQQVGGDFEASIGNLGGAIMNPESAATILVAPHEPGAYRLFVYAYDGNNHAAHANIPFYVSDQ
jgi:hypothetical protein